MGFLGVLIYNLLGTTDSMISKGLLDIFCFLAVLEEGVSLF
jgi:hypothetical protein